MSGHTCALHDVHVLPMWRHDYEVALLVPCPGWLQTDLLDFSVWGIGSHSPHLSMSI